MYDEVVDHPKVQRLSDSAFRAWINLMCLASRAEGRISGDVGDLGFALRKPRARVRELLDALVQAGLLDADGEDYRPHDWKDHQYESDSSTLRSQRSRQRCSNVAATPPDTEAESETDSQSDGAFEEFWKAYDPPKAARKPEARRAWAATADIRPPQDQLLRAVAAYCAWVAGQSAAQKRDYPMQHPATWLRGEVWNGFLDAGVDEGEARAAWDGQAGALVDAIGAAVFAAWFAGTGFEAGPPARITVPGEFRRKWIADHFGAALTRCYGDCRIEVGP
jgi:hypothetical protein